MEVINLSSSINLKEFTTLNDLEKLQVLERQVWKMEPLPIHQTLTVLKNGGIIIGAFQNSELIGFSYSFPGYKEEKLYLCSHMLGIHPEFQNKGIGFLLKQKQKEVAITRGYDLIIWTFDPLESRNAFLNTHKLGGRATAYLRDHYGELPDSLNAGIPSDRFHLEWKIKESKNKEEYQPVDDGLIANVRTRGDGLVEINSIELDKLFLNRDLFFVPIPKAFQLIKKRDMGLAKEWRLKTRDIFETLFSQGLVLIDVTQQKNEQICHYVFTKTKGDGK